MDDGAARMLGEAFPLKTDNWTIRPCTTKVALRRVSDGKQVEYELERLGPSSDYYVFDTGPRKYWLYWFM